MASRQAGKKRDVDADARPRPQDRSGSAPAPRRQRDDSPPRQPRKKKRAGKQRSGFGRLIYWGAVLALWAVIAAIGLLVWIGAHLPPIQSLEIPKRPPSVLILGLERRDARHPRRHGRRRSAVARIAGLRAEGVRRHRGPPLLLAPRHRSVGHLARRRARRAASRRHAGRLDPHPAARQEFVPDPGTHGDAQGCRRRCWRSGSSTNSPRRRSSSFISTASISAPAPTASRRRRSAISANRRGN